MSIIYCTKHITLGNINILLYALIKFNVSYICALWRQNVTKPKRGQTRAEKCNFHKRNVIIISASLLVVLL